MRCALQYDDEISFADQNINAWGELQSLQEDPSYRESDIKSPWNSALFLGYKIAMDDVIKFYEDTLSCDTDIEEFKRLCTGSICELLFSIIDEQDENEEEG